MSSFPFQFSFLGNITENTFPDIVFEITKEQDIRALSQFGLSEGVIACVEDNFHSSCKDHETAIDVRMPLFEAKRIFFFFPDEKELDQARGDFFRSLKRSFTYVSFTSDLFPLLDSILLSTYRFERYRSEKNPLEIGLYSPNAGEKTDLDDRLRLIANIYHVRDLINTPASHTNPESVVDAIREFPWKHTKVHILEKSKLKKLGMDLLLAVSAGSPNHPYVVIFERKDTKKKPSYGLVGKGVTFDSGGIQLKPWEAMHDMKLDLSGAATVIGLMQYLDGFADLPFHLIGAIGLVENMTGGNAYKPLDIYEAYNGKTVEIHHTDAEGRLLLADVMSYVEDVYGVEHLMTIATLTGACMHALGYNYAGVMGDDETTITRLEALSRTGEERVWRLPFNDHIGKSLKTDFADLRNISQEEFAGSSLGGVFLSHFRGKAKLTHLDIAGPSHRKTPYGHAPKGATGWGLLLLSEFFSGFKKKKK